MSDRPPQSNDQSNDPTEAEPTQTAPASTNGYQRIVCESPASGVARIMLNRPEAANAQDKQMLYELTAAFDAAAADDEVKVIILGAHGKHFSSGHDLRDRSSMDGFDTVGPVAGFAKPGAEGWMSTEQEIYTGMCARWRDIPKPTIAQVQGKVIAGGLMLVWPCDLVVASEDATFSDPVVAFGVNGVEYFAHAFELGARRAKELLFTGESMSAAEARDVGMVNRVVPRDELAQATLELAVRIASRPSMGLKLAKMSVNQSVDAMGFPQALQQAFGLQHVGHAHNQWVHGMLVDPAGAAVIRADAAAGR
ncbi:enoyl-CoA hydratase [Candidatus Poriferisodalis sp.]|uniref:enoyl-CoA hydratase n=1 Tax=Candidatus Poriferisodalis sp. TaxID=3101277 RepID=UPI003B012EAC